MRRGSNERLDLSLVRVRLGLSGIFERFCRYVKVAALCVCGGGFMAIVLQKKW